MSAAPLPSAGDWIRGITIKQPWAACVLTGAKTIENQPQPWFMDSSAVLHGV